MRRPIRNKMLVVMAVARRHGWNCIWCGRMTYRPKDGRQLSDSTTLEHLRPKSREGTNHISNLRIACYRCNNARNNRPEHVPVSERANG